MSRSRVIRTNRHVHRIHLRVGWAVEAIHHEAWGAVVEDTAGTVATMVQGRTVEGMTVPEVAADEEVTVEAQEAMEEVQATIVDTTVDLPHRTTRWVVDTIKDTTKALRHVNSLIRDNRPIQPR